MPYFQSFFWGIIAALGALFLELVIFLGYQIFSGQVLASTYFVASIPIIVLVSFSEELLKVFTIYKKIRGLFHSGQIFLGSLVFGCGFFLVELAMIMLNRETAWPNTLENFILHISTAGIIGYSLLGRSQIRLIPLVLVFLLIWGVHFLFNWLAITQTYYADAIKIALLSILVFFDLYGLMKSFRNLPYRKL